MQNYESVQQGGGGKFFGKTEEKRTSGQNTKGRANSTDYNGFESTFSNVTQPFNDTSQQIRRKSSNFVSAIVDGTILATFLTALTNPPPGYDDADLT